MADLWEYDEAISVYNEKALAADEDGETVDVPEWIEQDITPADVAAIVQGGCDSGAYMPAVTYHRALATMAEHGDDVLQYIEDRDRMPESLPAGSWAGLACWFLSAAVELWANSVENELDDMLDAIEKAAAETGAETATEAPADPYIEHSKRCTFAKPCAVCKALRDSIGTEYAR